MTRKTIPNSQSAISNQQSAIRSGSAIILAIVLTTLLAILGALFLLSSRVDSVATSAVGDNQDLKLAVDTVVAQISEAISSDVPRTDANGVPLEEYYDYPDDFNPWLASLEPNAAMLWPHITDLYYKFGVLAYNIPVNSSSAIIPEYQPTVGFGLFADADGDGVTDSRWAPILDKTSAKGKPIYAAIRIIDNGGMLNINTGYKFDPCGPIGSIDGSSQTQINFLALSALDNTHVLPGEKQDRLLAYRSGSEFNDIGLYEQKVVWQYGLPAGAYTPFDISDELNLRNRYIINRSRTTHTISRIETLWTHAFDGQPYVPRDTTIKDANWTWVTYNYYPFPCPDPCTYDNRHVATTYNCDRIINPAGQKMLNINSPLTFNKNLIYNAVREALDPCVVSSADIAQITANLMDYIDGTNYPPVGDPRYDPNNEVTEVNDPSTGTPRYGFETPCVYISEIAQNFYKPDPNSPGYDANDPNRVYRSYAIELFKPYWQDDEPNGWKLQVKNNIDNSFVEYDVNWTGSRRFHVIWSTDAGAIPFNIDLNEVPGPNDFNAFDPNNFNHLPQIADINFTGDKTIILMRPVQGSLIVDLVRLPAADINGSSWDINNFVSGYEEHSFERDITINRCIRKVWAPWFTNLPTLGRLNNFAATGTLMIQAHPQNGKFTNIGEIGQLLYRDTIAIDQNSTEAEVRLNLADPYVQNIFKYLTVMDPNELRYGGHPYDETRIKGRININTAPWFVLAQLPWVSYHTQPNYNLAQSIVNYRDTIHGPFKNIGELMNVSVDPNNLNRMDYYARTGYVFPALTPPDGGSDIFELRDAIFTRISNLVTVRSDVFTAYILIRIGTDGPQKRVIAILDRSSVTPAGGKVKVIAIQQVPDPR